MTPDRELLRRYAETRSEDAFAELVQRHLNFVYSAALRQVNGDAHLAQDVAQTVFTDLARKAHSLARRDVLTGWLYTSAHFAATKIVRTEQRRHAREQEAHTMCELLHDPAPELDWGKLRPVLDKVMHELKETDREAILLRYFENRQFAEIGEKLGLNENAARMRVERALEKLRGILAHRGVMTVTALSTVISANAVQIAPAGLAVTLTSASLTVAGTGTTLTLMKIMTMTKLKLGISALVVAGAAATLVIQHQAQTKLREENQSLRQQMDQLQVENERLSNSVAQANSSSSRPDDQLTELLRLRGEVRLLRQRTNELGKLQAAQTNRTKNQQQSEAAMTAEKQQAFAIMKMNSSKQAALAMIMYAQDNHEQFPTNFDQAINYLGGNSNPAISNFTQIDIVYQGVWTNIASPATTIIARDNQAWAYDGKWAKSYAFGDGHCEIHSEPDGNFDAWEQQHMVSPPPNQ
jgi:RNA polymerase sigma factor (sigma-70 family)